MTNQRGFIRFIVIGVVAILGLYATLHFILVPKVFLPYLAEHGTEDQKAQATYYLRNQKSYPDDASCVYKQDVIPMYGDKLRCARLKQADADFISDANKVNGGNRQSGAFKISWNGTYYFFKGDYDTAMKRFNQAWLLTPDSSDIYWNFAILLEKQGKTDQALAMVDKTFNSKDASYVGEYCDVIFLTDKSNQNGRISKQDQFYSKVQDYLKKASKPLDSSQCHFGWVLDYYLSGDYDNARKEIDLAKQQSLTQNQQSFIDAIIKKMSDPNSSPLM